MSSPIFCLPWGQPFVERLAGWILDDGAGPPERCEVVLPAKRAAAAFRQAYGAAFAARTRRSGGVPALAPRVFGLEDWIDERLRPLRGPAPVASGLVRACLLHEVVGRLGRAPGQTRRSRLKELPPGLDGFLPWGRALADVMEEAFRHAVRMSDVPANSEDLGLLPEAAALLGELSAIQAAYRAALEDRGLTTPGLNRTLLAENVARLLAGDGARTTILAGFLEPSKAEDRVFRALWESGGGRVVFHADPALALPSPERETAGLACRAHAGWLARWSARAEWLAEAKRPDWSAVRIVQGHDLHSQIEAARMEMECPAPEAKERTAIILPRPAPLPALLRALPVTPEDVTMGWPAGRSGAFRLLETCLTACERASLITGTTAWSWRDALEIVRDPLVRSMRPSPEEDPGVWRVLLRALDQAVRAGGRLLRREDIFTLALAARDKAPALRDAPEPHFAAALGLLDRLLRAGLEVFQTVRDFPEMAAALRTFAGLIRKAAAEALASDPLEAECAALLDGAVAASLAEVETEEGVDRATLFAALRGEAAAARVSFASRSSASSGAQVAGTQIMGLFESRAQSFDRALILDVAEGALPVADKPDPLLPDGLRQMAGMPEKRGREADAHAFFSLLASCKSATVLYPAGVVAGAGGGERAVRSRFVERLLFEIEKARGQLIRPEPLVRPDPSATPPVFAVVNLPLEAPRPLRPAMAVTPVVQARLAALLASRPVSATFLDSYLNCPLRFALERLCGLTETGTPREEGDAGAIGTLAHEMLKEFFESRLGQKVAGQLFSKDEIDRLKRDFADRLRACDAYAQMRYEVALAAGRVGARRLEVCLRTTPETVVEALETEIVADLDLTGVPPLANGQPAPARITVTGKLDRVDRRDKGPLVLDYKTSRSEARLPAKKLWGDEALWRRVAQWPSEGEPGGDDPLPALADALRSTQLPLYLWLYAKRFGEYPADAAIIAIGRDAKEKGLTGDPDLAKTIAGERVPLLVAFLVRRMLFGAEFAPRFSRACGWCPHATGCGRP